MFSWWVGQMCASTASSMSRPTRRRAVTARPWDSVVQVTTALVRQGQAPHLLGLLLVVPAAERPFPGVGERTLERVQVLALVQLAADSPPVGLVGPVPGRADDAAQRPVLLDRPLQGVLLPLLCA